MSISGNSVWFVPLFLSFLAAAAPLRPPPWQSVEDSPPPRAEPDQRVLFPCRFSAERDRCVWDGPLPEGLTEAGRLTLHLSCDRPEALRGLTLYLRGENGWWAAALAVPESTGRTYFLSAADFQPAEPGTTGTWSRVRGVRLAAWKKAGFLGEAALRLHRFSAFQDSIFILRADSSAPPEEQAVAHALSQRISGWLKDLGIGHSVIPDSLWRTFPPRHTRLLILPYNPRPDAAFLEAFQAYRDTGGRAIVFYGASPELAHQMGFSLAPYQAAPSPVTWSAFTFDPPLGSVGRVYQTSLHTIPAVPNHPQARVRAWWEGPKGERRPEAAWLESPSGWWMTHVLDPEDALLKKRMLLEMIGAVVPDAWGQAAQSAMARLPTEATDSERRRLQTLASQRAWPAFWAERDRLAEEWTRRAIAALPPPASPSALAGWAQPGAGFLSSDWPRLVGPLRSAGISRLYLSAIAFGQAHYAGAPFSPSDVAAFDPAFFESAVRACREAGIEVHAWITCFNVAYASSTRLAAWRLAGRLIETPVGEVPWLTPAHPDNRRLLLDAIADVLRRGPIAGIHLDYIRLPGEGVDISPAARRAFEAAYGPVARWPADVLAGGPREGQYRSWWIALIAAFVREAREQVRALRSEALLSAAVFPEYPYCREGLMQDWAEWLRAGAVDEVCPMAYTASGEELDRWMGSWKTFSGWGQRIRPGLGVSADIVTLDGPAFVDQMRRAQKAGAPGVAIFWINRPFLRDLAPLLAGSRLTPTTPASATSRAEFPENRALADR